MVLPDVPSRGGGAAGHETTPPLLACVIVVSLFVRVCAGGVGHGSAITQHSHDKQHSILRITRV